jgi:predicted ATPase
MEVLIEQLALISRRNAVLVLFEDAHWIDPTSIELIDKTIRRVWTCRS